MLGGFYWASQLSYCDSYLAFKWNVFIVYAHWYMIDEYQKKYTKSERVYK